MFSPRIKRLIFKALLTFFVPDYLAVYRRYIETRMLRKVMEHLLRVVTSLDFREARLSHLAERMGDLQKSICQLCERGFTDEEIADKLDISLCKIKSHLDLIEQEIHHLSRYSK